MANEYTRPDQFDLIGLLQRRPDIWRESEERGEKTMRTYDQLMAELQTMKSGRSEVNSKVEQLIFIYNRIAKKGSQDNHRVFPFLDTCSYQ